MKTNVYIDGFNLYHRALQRTAYKWLDLSKLAQALVPAHTVNRIRYFTAIVQRRRDDPGQQRRHFTPHFPYQPCRACRNQQRNYPM